MQLLRWRPGGHHCINQIILILARAKEVIHFLKISTDKAEIASLKETKVKAKKTNMGPKRSTPMNPDGSLTIDLHIEAIPGGTNVPKGQQLQFQMDTFRRIIRQNTSRRGMKITFIHGIGDGILKAAIRKELNEVLALRCSYSVGDPAVTVVTIR